MPYCNIKTTVKVEKEKEMELKEKKSKSEIKITTALGMSLNFLVPFGVLFMMMEIIIIMNIAKSKGHITELEISIVPL